MATCKGLIKNYTHIPKPTSKTQMTKVNEVVNRVGCDTCGATDKTLYRVGAGYRCKEHRES